MTEFSQADAQEKLWDAVVPGKTGMLGLCGAHDHMQPMTAQGERETGTIWFYTYKDTDLAKKIAAAGDAAKGMFCINDGRELFACLAGQMSLERDATRIEKFWNPMVAAWYPEGKNDLRLTLIRFDLEDAQVWLTEKGLIGTAAEVVRANVAHQTPDLGARVSLRF